jgi:hypothetical protein
VLDLLSLHVVAERSLSLALICTTLSPCADCSSHGDGGNRAAVAALTLSVNSVALRSLPSLPMVVAGKLSLELSSALSVFTND